MNLQLTRPEIGVLRAPVPQGHQPPHLITYSSFKREPWRALFPEGGMNTTCTIPRASRRWMNSTLPWSRMAFHPSMRSTSFPA